MKIPLHCREAINLVLEQLLENNTTKHKRSLRFKKVEGIRQRNTKDPVNEPSQLTGVVCTLAPLTLFNIGKKSSLGTGDSLWKRERVTYSGDLLLPSKISISFKPQHCTEDITSALQMRKIRADWPNGMAHKFQISVSDPWICDFKACAYSIMPWHLWIIGTKVTLPWIKRQKASFITCLSLPSHLAFWNPQLSFLLRRL